MRKTAPFQHELKVVRPKEKGLKVNILQTQSTFKSSIAISIFTLSTLNLEVVSDLTLCGPELIFKVPDNPFLESVVISQKSKLSHLSASESETRIILNTI